MVKIPNNYTEEDVLAIIDKISGRLANRYRFGYHETSDMKQQATLIALQGLESYDGMRPLENFLWVHVKNRLYNFKRNNYARPDKPCLNCPLNAYKNKKCTAFDVEMDCEIYAKWSARNEVKKNLMSTKEHVDMTPNNDSSLEDQILAKDIYKLIDDNIPIALREDWVRYINKLKLPKNKRECLHFVILEILKENGIGT